MAAKPAPSHERKLVLAQLLDALEQDGRLLPAQTEMLRTLDARGSFKDKHPLTVIASREFPDAKEGGRKLTMEALLAWLGARDARGVTRYRERLPSHTLVDLPLLPQEPSDLASLDGLRALVAERLTQDRSHVSILLGY